MVGDKMDFIGLSRTGSKSFVLHDELVWIYDGSSYRFYGSLSKWRRNTSYDSTALTQYGVIAKGVKEQGNDLETEKEIMSYIRMAKEGELY